MHAVRRHHPFIRLALIDRYEMAVTLCAAVDQSVQIQRLGEAAAAAQAPLLKEAVADYEEATRLCRALGAIT